MDFRAKLSNGEFVVTSEIGPPKGVDIRAAMDNALSLKGRVDAINVTDQQSSVMRMGSLAMSHLLMDKGIEPVYQLTCRDRNRLALQSDLLSADALGVRNVLALTGDHPSLGDHPGAKPVFDLDAVTLIDIISKLNGGFDMSGNPLSGKPDLFVGAAVNHGADPLEPEIIKMRKKIAAGAEFFQTQAVFDVPSYEKFSEEIKGAGKPVIAGIVLLKSAGMARYMNKHVPGVNVPDGLIAEMDAARDKKAKSVEIAVRLIKAVKGMSQGIHIMPIGWDSLVVPVLEGAGLTG